jgi:hypothetical protein
MVLKWSTFKFTSIDPDLHPRWPPSADIVLNIFSIGLYVKTMSADGGHLGWKSGSQDIILKVDHLRTIHAMFALKLYPVTQTSIQDGHHQRT